MYYLKVSIRDWNTDRKELIAQWRKYSKIERAKMALGKYSTGCVCKYGSNTPIISKIDGHWVSI